MLLFRRRKDFPFLFLKAQNLSHAANKDQLNGMEKSAMKKFRKAMNLFIILKDESGEATCLNNMGLILESKGRLHKALKIYRKALLLDVSQMKVLEEAITILNIGRINEKHCDYQDALLNFKKALRIFTKINLSSGLLYLKEETELRIKNLKSILS